MLPIFVLLLLTVVRQCDGGVAGLDLGSEFIKVAVVKPGSGVEIVLNQQSARKSASYLGFRGDERYFGEDAFSLHTRFPSNMITYVKNFLGVEHETLTKFREQLLFPYFSTASTPRDTATFQVQDGVWYTSEELMAMLLTHIKEFSAKHAGMPITDVAITVPAHFTIRQRQAIVDAAAVAGLNVLVLMHDTTAAALHYGVQNRGFQDKPVNVVIFDMGASSLEVGVVTFHPPANSTDGKKSKKANALGTMQVRSFAADDTNGGRHLDAVIAKHIAKKFQEKSGVDVLALKTPAGYKAVAKLMRSAKKAKETLSANKDVVASVEGIWEEKDFNLPFQRSELEAMAAPFALRAIETLQLAIARANLTLDDIDSIELMGGGSRVPALQDALQAYVKKPLGRSLNTDEASVMGAAFHAARLSGSFRVRSFDIQVPNEMNVYFALSPDDEHPNPAIRPLFLQSVLPARKLITVFRQKSFNITVSMKVSDEKTGAEEYVVLEEFSLQGLASTFERLGVGKPDAHPDNKHSVEIKVRMSEYGLVTIESATAKFDEVVRTTKKVKIVTPPIIANLSAQNTSTPNATASEDKEDADGADSEEESNVNATANATATPNVTATPQEPKYEIVNTTKIVNHREAIVVITRHVLRPLPMEPVDIANATATLARLKAVDDEKLRLAESRNNLESLILDTKYDGFFGNDKLKPFYNASEAEEIRRVLEETETWLEESSEDAPIITFKRKFKELDALVGAVKKRYEDNRLEKLLNETLAKGGVKGGNATAANASSSKAANKTTGASAEESEAKPEASGGKDIPEKGDNDDDDDDGDDDDEGGDETGKMDEL